MAHLEKLRAVTQGRGRVTWGMDFNAWNPRRLDRDQPDDLWLAAWSDVARGELLHATGPDGAEALRRLLVAAVKHFGDRPAMN